MKRTQDPELPNLQTYVLAASRTMSHLLLNRLNKVEEKTGLDIITLELANELIKPRGIVCYLLEGYPPLL